MEASHLPAKQSSLSGVENKLKAAEAGRLKDVVKLQAGLAAEKSLADSLRETAKAYSAGVGLNLVRRDFENLRATAGELTGDAASTAAFASAKAVIERANAFALEQEKALNAGLAALSRELEATLPQLEEPHTRMGDVVSQRTRELQAQGLSMSLADLNKLVEQRTRLTREINAIRAKAAQLQGLREARTGHLQALDDVRSEILARRKGQVRTINASLGSAIPDYQVFLSLRAFRGY